MIRLRSANPKFILALLGYIPDGPFICLQGFDWELLVAHSQDEQRQATASLPLSQYKDNVWDQLLAGADAQIRPEPRGNPVLGYKLTCGRAVPLEVQATPSDTEHNRALEKLNLCQPPMARAH